MTGSIMANAHDLMSSPWIYLALFAFAALDAFAPVFPSEALVITAGVFAAHGEPDLVAVMTVAALGAIAGDHVAYLIGRSFGPILSTRLRPRTRRGFERAQQAAAERGGLLLVVARYVPGGRTAATLTMGMLGYRRRSFLLFDTIAGVSWGVYGALVGYLGGRAFEDDPLRGVVLGIGIALAATAAVELVRYARKQRRSPSADHAGAEHDTTHTADVGAK